MIQDVSDGFQEKKPRRCVMALLDLSRAYDRVWKEDLILTLIDSVVPLKLVRWFNAFLSNRQFQVMFNGSLSRTRWLINGVPQGAVTSPLLFIIFYINSLPDEIKDLVNDSLFADDLTIWSSHNNKEEASRYVQLAVQKIEERCKKKKMLLSEKSVVTFFSSSSGDARWKPDITMGGNTLKFDPCPKLLGLVINRTLSFQQHVDKVVDKVRKRCNLLACLGTSNWGWRKKPLGRVFLATQQSIMDFNASAWQPCLSKTQMDRLNRAQNQALRRVTGQAASTPVEALRLESGMQSYRTISQRLTAISRERASRCPEGHPARIALEKDQRHRICRDSWRELSNRISFTLPNERADREPLPTIEKEVWTPQRRWLVNNTVGGLGRSEETKQKATETIRNIDATWTIYTDGSAKDGTRDGGSAMVVTTGDPLDPQTIFSETISGRMLTSPFDEEKEALGAAVRWLEDITPNNSDKGLIFTDSQALTSALANDSREVSNITRKLDTLNREIIIQWIPSQVGIVGNERADALANEASGLKERAKPTTYKSAVANIKRTIKDTSPSHARTAQVYQKLSREREEKTLLSRRDAVMLARLRSGHSMLLAGYRTLMNPAESPPVPDARRPTKQWNTGSSIVRAR